MIIQGHGIRLTVDFSYIFAIENLNGRLNNTYQNHIER